MLRSSHHKPLWTWHLVRTRICRTENTLLLMSPHITLTVMYIQKNKNNLIHIRHYPYVSTPQFIKLVDGIKGSLMSYWLHGLPLESFESLQTFCYLAMTTGGKSSHVASASVAPELLQNASSCCFGGFSPEPLCVVLLFQ